MQSLKSTALEPTRPELAGLTRWRAAARILPVYGLPILALALAVFFSILLPDSFPTALNIRSILSDKGIIVMLSLGAMLPMMAGRIDLTIGFGIVMWHILAISLQVWYHVPWPLAILVVLLCSAFSGLINGMLVEVAQIDSIIATLGTGTILYALALWLSGGRQVMGILAPGFIDVNALSPLGIPMPAVYVIVLGAALWIFTERLPLGRSSTRSVPTKKPRHSMASRCGPTWSGCSSAPGWSPASPVACSHRNCRSARRMSAWTTCCRRWSAPSSAPPRSSPAG